MSIPLARIAPTIRQLKQIYNTSQNPMAALAQMQDPRLKEVMDMVRGKNPKEVFYSKCKEMGVNPNEILGMLR